MRNRTHRFSRVAAMAVLLGIVLLLAFSWLGAWIALADLVNIGALYWWPLALLGAVWATWLLRHRRALWPGVAVIFATLTTGIMLFRPLLVSGPQPSARTQTVSMIEYNMLKWNPQSEADAEWLAGYDADILVLLEASRMQKRWGRALQAKYPTMVSCSTHYPCSTVLFSKFPLIESRSLAGDGDADNRQALSALTATLDVEGMPLTVFALHLDRPWPMGQQNIWVPPIRDVAAGITGPAVMAGDFNSAPWTHAIRSIGESGDFRLGSGFTTSWPADWAAPLRLPLDQIYLRGKVRAIDVETGPKRGSDHLPLLIELELPAGS